MENIKNDNSLGLDLNVPVENVKQEEQINKIIEDTTGEKIEIANEDNEAIEDIKKDIPKEQKEVNEETKEVESDEVEEVDTKDLSTDEKIKSYEKQIKDLRRLVAKNKKAPKTAEEYDNDIDSMFKRFYDTEAGKRILRDAKEEAFKNNLSKEQFKNNLDFINRKLVEIGLIDTRTDKEREADLNKWRQEQYKLIGPNAEQTIKVNVDFINTSSNFNKTEKEQLLRLVDSGVVGLSIVNKIRNYLDYNRAEYSEIPTTINTGESPDLVTLIKQYKKEKDNEKAAELFNKIIKANGGELPTNLLTF